MTESFGEAIKRKRIEQGLSQKKLGLKVGVTGTYIADMENYSKIPKDSVVLKMAQALGIDPTFFLFMALKERAGGDEEVVQLYERAFMAYSRARVRGEIDGSEEEMPHSGLMAAKVEEALERGFRIIIADPEHIREEPYRSLVEEIENRVKKGRNGEALEFDLNTELSLPYNRTVPVISLVSAGEPFRWTNGDFEQGVGLEKISLPAGVDPKLAGKIYAVRVRGDSMSPYLKDGATLFIKIESRDEVRDGDYVIFKDEDNNAWVKMILFRNDLIILRSLNTDYPDLVKAEDEHIILEKVISIAFL